MIPMMLMRAAGVSTAVPIAISAKGWRITITANQTGKNYSGLTELIFKNNSSQVDYTGAVRFGSSRYEGSSSSTYHWDYAFDGLDENSPHKWLSGNNAILPQYAGLVFVDPITVDEYAINISNFNEPPKSWDIQYSLDTTDGHDGNWITVDTQSDVTDWPTPPDSETRSFEFDNPPLTLTTLVPGDGTTAWENMVNVSPGEGTIERPSGDGWNAGATFVAIPANTDGEIFFKGSSVTENIMGGLSSTPGGSGYTDIDYALHFSSGTIYIWENGVSRGSFGTLDVLAEYSIRREEGVVTYLKDDVLIYTSSVAAFADEVLFDSSVESTGIQLFDIRAEYYS